VKRCLGCEERGRERGKRLLLGEASVEERE
jgi:hypothetical protein